jgi:hypothetical protein
MYLCVNKSKKDMNTIALKLGMKLETTSSAVYEMYEIVKMTDKTVTLVAKSEYCTTQIKRATSNILTQIQTEFLSVLG